MRSPTRGDRGRRPGKRYIQHYHEESGHLTMWYAPAMALRVTLDAEVHAEAIRAALRDGRLSADRWAAETPVDPAYGVTASGWASLAEGWAAEPRELVGGHEMHLVECALVTAAPAFKTVMDAQRPWRPLWAERADGTTSMPPCCDD